MKKYFKTCIGADKKDHVLEWESKGLSNEVIKAISLPNNRLIPELIYVGTKTRVYFKGSCLKQDNITYTHGKIVNIYTVYKLIPTLNDFDFALENCLFVPVKLTKNADIDKNKYSGYGIRFDERGIFLFPGSGFRQNVIILELI